MILRSDRAETLIEHFGGLAKCGVSQSRIDVAEVRVVQKIEGFRLEDQREGIIEMEGPPDAAVPLGLPEATHEATMQQM